MGCLYWQSSELLLPLKRRQHINREIETKEEEKTGEVRDSRLVIRLDLGNKTKQNVTRQQNKRDKETKRDEMKIDDITSDSIHPHFILFFSTKDCHRRCTKQIDKHGTTTTGYFS